MEQPGHGGHVHFDHFFFPGSIRFQIAAADAEARVVDENVDVLPCQRGAQPGAVRFVGKVGGQDAAGRAQLGREGFEPVGAAGGEDEPTAHFGVAACKLLPDAGACASDPDGFGHCYLHFAGGFFLPLPLGEVSPQVTERAMSLFFNCPALSASLRSAAPPKGGVPLLQKGKSSF